MSPGLPRSGEWETTAVIEHWASGLGSDGRYVRPSTLPEAIEHAYESEDLPAARARPRAQCHPVADDSQVTLAHIMSEGDINLYGTIHGGVVMKLIDDATAAAARHAGGPR